MIISSKKNFAFIHIPKNAGSNIRNQIKACDDYDGDFNQILSHPVLGKTHTAHLTLNELKQCYPEAYESMVNLESIAILRDPFERFTSALNQRLREFSGLSQSQINQQILESEAQRVLSLIDGSLSDDLPLEFVHFRKQKDFIIDPGGNQIIKHLFDFKNLKDLVDWFEDNTGISIDLEAESSKYNATLDIKSSRLKFVVNQLKPIANLLPIYLKDKIRDFLLFIGVYGRTSANTTQSLMSNEKIRIQIEKYYAEDIELYRRQLD